MLLQKKLNKESSIRHCERKVRSRPLPACFIALAMTGLFLCSCTGKSPNESDIIVKAGDQVLTRIELNESLPPFLNSADSMLAAEHFIRMWINDRLLYALAQKNISDKKEIEQLVENYRRSLIIYQYQEQLVNEKLAKEINEKELGNFYKDNKDKFQLDKPLIKGLFLKIPKEAPQIEQVRTWCKKLSSSSIGNIEKYSVQNAASFDYFEDKWVDFNELTNNFPVSYRNNLEIIKKSTFFEQKDDRYFYFLNIIDYLLPGDHAPFEYAEATVKEMLINQKKIEFLRKTEEDIYNKALNNGQILFYNE